MHNIDMLMCFESIATLLYNHCQLWFEFAPLQMPYNYLGLIENVLSDCDRKLFAFYKSKDVTSKIYAMPLMETAFSEVLDEQQWLQLWDHVVSNEPWFVTFVIVAYNVLQRTSIMRCASAAEVERMFREQNYVNLPKLINKAYRLMEKCPAGIHPKRFMKSFEVLADGEYQKFAKYPTNVIDTRTGEQQQSLLAEQQMLDAKIAELEKLEQSMAARFESHCVDEENEKRMKGKFAKACCLRGPQESLWKLKFADCNAR